MVGFALASIILMTVDHRLHYLESVRSGLSLVVAPIRYVVGFPEMASTWLGEVFAFRLTLLEENGRLREEHLLLRSRLLKLEALAVENQRLRLLLESSPKLGERVRIAHILSVATDQRQHLVVINKGSAQGVYLGQPVVDAYGILGQVVHVDPVTATVMLITDAQQGIPVQVNRNGLRTIAVGSGEIGRLDLPYLPNNADIHVGDLLVTSGLGGRLPEDYPVAEISKIEYNPGDPFASVSAAPTAHLDRSREVLLVWTEEERAATEAAAPPATPGEPEPERQAAAEGTP